MRGRPLIIPWQEDAPALYALYRQEPDAALRTRWHALWLLRGGRGLAETAHLVGVHYVTFSSGWPGIGRVASPPCASIATVGGKGGPRT